MVANSKEFLNYVSWSDYSVLGEGDFSDVWLLWCGSTVVLREKQAAQLLEQNKLEDLGASGGRERG